MRIRKRFSVIVLTAMTIGIMAQGCATYGPRVPPSETPRTGERLPVAYFSYEAGTTPEATGEPRNWGLYEVQALRMALSLTEAKQKVYRLHYYRPHGRGPFPAVVVLPITRGDYFTQNLSIYLAERGFAALRFESTRNFTDDSYKTLEGAERLIRHYAIDIRRSIDWLVSREEVDPDRLGITGISLGGIMASLVMEADPRIKAGAFLLGGGGIGNIIDSSAENSLIKFKKRVLAHQAVDRFQFRQEANRALNTVDPITYADLIDPSKVLMINARFDHVIRIEHVLALWEAIGRPELVFVPAGHYSSGLFFPYARARATAHLARLLQ